MFRVDLPSCAVPPRNGTFVGVHFGRLSQGAPFLGPAEGIDWSSGRRWARVSEGG
jgi:hypothetical protein